jgi:dTDP-4-dehydrorhamnose 3,5-epimerase
MIFTETGIPRAFVIAPERHEDERGFFTRVWCQRECEAQGMNPHFVQCNISFNTRQGTLRGMHWQADPYGEAKLVRCTRGAIYDVIIDLRPDSGTFKHHYAVILTAENYTMLYVPEGCAHGFLTLVDETEVFYQMSQFYHPESQRGVRWNDPAFGIHWIADVQVMSRRDNSYPNFEG